LPHRKVIECQLQVDDLLGLPGNDGDKNRMRNADRMVDHGRARKGLTIGASEYLTRKVFMDFWGYGVDGLGEQLKAIHQVTHIVLKTLGGGLRRIQIKTEDVQAYVPAVVSYDPAKSKYADQMFVRWSHVPEEFQREPGVDAVDFLPRDGVWPCVHVVLKEEALHKFNLKKNSFLVCVYQILWKPPVARELATLTESIGN
jgi:hypothetical protein